MSGEGTRASRAGSGEMSRGRDVAEGTFPQWAVLFEMTAGSTLETPVMVEDSGVSRSLSLKRSGSVRGTMAVPGGGSGTGDGSWARVAVSCRRKDGRNHPSESHKIEGRESGASTKRRGYGAGILRRRGDRRRGRDGVNLVDGVRGGRDDGRIGKLEMDPSIGVR